MNARGVVDDMAGMVGLIDTLWNVNITAGWQKLTEIAGLIDTLWNVNTIEAGDVGFLIDRD